MTRRAVAPDGVLAGAFGFDPAESPAHFVVRIPGALHQPVEISEHLSWSPETADSAAHYGEAIDGQVRSRLARATWNAIAEPVRAELNARLKKDGRAPGRWRTGANPIARLLGKELTLLAWAIEDADPGVIPTAIANWHGLTPEERWWLYTMTAAATGDYQNGRGVGWRKAVRYALTENPVTAMPSEQPIVPEFFRLVSGSSEDDEANEAKRPRRKKGSGR